MGLDELLKELSEELKDFVPYDEVYDVMNRVRKDYVFLKLWEYVKKQTNARKEFIWYLLPQSRMRGY